MKKILVLCTGNSCRSQMAEGYLNYYAQGRAEFFSAGISPTAIHPLTFETMAEDNIDISGQTSKSFALFKGVKLDFLITVCDDANNRLPKVLKAKNHIHFSIPDPAAVEGGEAERLEAFRQIREVVKRYILKFIGKELSDVPQALIS